MLAAMEGVPMRKEMSGELPPDVWSVLKKELPKGGLRSFLTRHPDKFEITSAANAKLTWRRIASRSRLVYRRLLLVQIL